MKKNILQLSILLLLITVGFENAFAQLTLPAPSPKASVMQTVGLTDITIDYSSPGVKGRTIWGDLLPYDSLWRAGANAATKITFSKDVTVGGTAVPKGSYSIHMIPSKAEWTIILNKNANASTADYKKEEDIVRIKVKPETIANRERLTYIVSDFTDESASVDMEWEKVRVSIPVKMATNEQALASINNTLNSTWRTYTNAARYMLDTKKDYEEGLKLIYQSISLSADQWFSHWIKAQLLAAKQMNKEALASAQKAKELGDKNPAGFFYKTQVEKALVDWKTK